jgi:hypothetical protein
MKQHAPRDADWPQDLSPGRASVNLTVMWVKSKGLAPPSGAHYVERPLMSAPESAPHPAPNDGAHDVVEEIVPMMPIVLPIVGAVLMFLLAFIAVTMA